MVRGGGFAGLVRTLTADEADLDPADAATFRTLVDKADLAHLSPPTRPAYPDVPILEITLEDGDETHTVLIPDPDLPDDVRTLLDWLDTVPNTHKSMGPPG